MRAFSTPTQYFPLNFKERNKTKEINKKDIIFVEKQIFYPCLWIYDPMQERFERLHLPEHFQDV